MPHMSWNSHGDGAAGYDDVVDFGRRGHGAQTPGWPRPAAVPRGGRTGRAVFRAFLAVAIAVLAVSGAGLARAAAVVPETGHSMEAALRPGEDLVVARGQGVSRGDIVVLRGLAGGPVLSRVIALPGDQVLCCDAAGQVMVNGLPVAWDSIALDRQSPGTAYSLTLGSGQIWVLGDNRAAATDSRTLGPVPLSAVEGRVIATWHDGSLAAVRTPEPFVRGGLAPPAAAIPASVERPAATAAGAAAALFLLAVFAAARRLCPMLAARRRRAA